MKEKAIPTCHGCSDKVRDADSHLVCSDCQRVFCSECLRSNFADKMKKITPGTKAWNCPECRERCMPGVLAVKQWRGTAYLRNEKVFCGPKRYCLDPKSAAEEEKDDSDGSEYFPNKKLRQASTRKKQAVPRSKRSQSKPPPSDTLPIRTTKTPAARPPVPSQPPSQYSGINAPLNLNFNLSCPQQYVAATYTVSPQGQYVMFLPQSQYMQYPYPAGYYFPAPPPPQIPQAKQGEQNLAPQTGR